MGGKQTIEQRLEKLALEIEEIRRDIHKEKEETTVLGNLVNLAYSDTTPHSNWILDSGASRHVNGM